MLWQRRPNSQSRFSTLCKASAVILYRGPCTPSPALSSQKRPSKRPWSVFMLLIMKAQKEWYSYTRFFLFLLFRLNYWLLFKALVIFSFYTSEKPWVTFIIYHNLLHNHTSHTAWYRITQLKQLHYSFTSPFTKGNNWFPLAGGFNPVLWLTAQ